MNGYRSVKQARPMSQKGIQELHYSEPGKLSYSCCFMLSATTLLFSMLTPLLFGNSQTHLEIWAWAMVITCVLLAWLLIKKIRWIFLTVLMSLIFISFSGSALIPAFVLGAVYGVCAYATLIGACGKKNIFFPIATPLLIYVISLVLTLDPVRSLYSLIFVIPALAMGLASLSKSDLNTSVLACTVATIVPLIAFFAISTYSRYGSLSFETMTGVAADIRIFFEAFAEEYISYAGQTELTQSLYSEISEAVNSYVNLAPGLIVALCLSLSFVIHSLKNDLLEAQDFDQAAIVKSRTLSVSAITALVFLLAYIMSFTTDASNNTSFIAVVFGNISFMLIPCLALTGIGAIMILPKKFGILGVIPIVLLIVLLFNKLSSFFILLALVGAFFVITRKIDSWAKEFYNKGDN
ncbi:MAG: DUF2232 domain-containing protein [Clostridia bacterium]|nr:DUF2232 domain-containing protein [Clostridia bacterium]